MRIVTWSRYLTLVFREYIGVISCDVSLFSGDRNCFIQISQFFCERESGEPANIEDPLRAELWGIESKSVVTGYL